MLSFRSFSLVILFLSALWPCVTTLSTAQRNDSRDLTESTTRIVGGSKTGADRYSYQAITGRIRTTRKNIWQCGGTLIAPDVIMTAAHCIPERTREKKKWGAQIGRYDLSDNREKIEFRNDVIEQTARRILIFPSYTDPSDPGSNITWTNDLALMFFPRKFTRNSNDHEYVRLNTDSAVPADSDVLSVVGWGDTDAVGDEVNDFKLETTVVYDDTCGNFGNDTRYNAASMLCGDGGGTNNTCRGDSGGPILIKGKTDASDVQVGITSFGSKDCAGEGIPGVYTRISEPAMMKWIMDEVCGRSRSPPAYFNCASKCIDKNISCRNVSERKCSRKRFEKRCCASCEKYA